ncbi:cell division protein FtsQ/DivIB [Mucilaginibacter ginsenosidivorans]|uniref:cell division protein FtsQ/DivIB n=1 Tax=Mucilaginibacter ginsenosidivorans TaxID=398053 RepID=UPI0016520C93|nr:cell division protein FtsQ [Mucilaginibacter ginsenosidivorans]
MFKKRIWRHILIGSAWVITLGGLVVLMSFIEFKKAGVVCKDVKVYIPGNQYFIDREEVDNILKIHRHKLVGRKMDEIDIHDLEEKLKANPFIESAMVYADMDGVIRVKISQRQPVVRVMNQFDQNFYIDQNGLKIPLSDNFTARVIAANGYIDEIFGKKVDTLHTDIARQILKAANFISRDSLWSAQVAQIYVNQNHEIELIPRVGTNRIMLGNADSLESKFANLYTFYKKAIPQVGWDRYKTINIKYANEVVGVKSDNFKKDSLKAVARADSMKLKQDTSQIVN